MHSSFEFYKHTNVYNLKLLLEIQCSAYLLHKFISQKQKHRFQRIRNYKISLLESLQHIPLETIST